MADTHHWTAHYSDGTTLDEYDEAGQSRGFADVDLSRLVALEFIPIDGGRGVCVRVPHDARPILFRRRLIDVNVDTEEVAPTRTIACLGWQRTVKGVNQKAILALYEDNSVLLTDDSDGL